jgi:hypothetical protein
MIEQLEYIDISLDELLIKLTNCDYEGVARVFGKAAWKEHDTKRPHDPICQWHLFCKEYTEKYLVSKQAELGDLNAMFDLCTYYLRRHEFNPNDIEESLIYLGEKGIYKAYAELAHWFNGFDAMNIPKHFEEDLDKLKYYYLKAIDIVNKSITLTEFEKIVKTIIIHKDLHLKLKDDKYIELNKNLAGKVYEKYTGNELIIMSKLYIGGNLGYDNNLNEADKFINKYLEYNELTEEVNEIKEDINKMKNKEMDFFEELFKYRSSI